MRLRFLCLFAPKVNGKHKPEEEVVFAPMEAISDGLGGLSISETRSFGEVSSGSYNYFKKGDFLLAKVTPCFENGKKAFIRGINNKCGFATSEVHVIRPIAGRINPNYLLYILSSEDFRASCMASMTGAGGLRRVSEDAIRNYEIKINDLSEQRAIADFLDRETARIDQLIQKKQRLVELTSEHIDSLVDMAISDSTLPLVRLGNLVQRKYRKVQLADHNELIRLGLFNRGRGVFKKAPTDEEGMGESDFFYVKSGDLIISGQFAWEGAIALASKDEESCVVSHRYPIYRGKGNVNTAYLFAFLRSSRGDFLLENCSRGSAGRNRPLNTTCLEREKIPYPSLELQNKIENAVKFHYLIKSKINTSIERLKEYRSALITAAVTGQIGVDFSNK